MTEIADDLWHITGLWKCAFNAYLAGDVLIDGMTRWDTPRILRELKGRKVSVVALTHAHPDHQGAVNAVCERFEVPLACHELDKAGMEGTAPLVPQNALCEVVGNIIWAGKRRPVDRVLREGDMVGEFRVIHAPGHTAGHVIYFRQRDRVAIAGDVLNNNNFLPGTSLVLREPPWMYSADPMENRRSIRKLYELKPQLICFGHGPPLRDMSKLERMMQRKGF